jgi:dihydrofolate reductase
MNLSIIIAVSQNGVIGFGGKIPWHIPEDLKWFKLHTINKTIIMGRKTHESIGRKLSGRLNIVISRNENYLPLDNSVLVYTKLSEALKEHADFSNELFVIGGSQLYVEALPVANKIYLTKIFDDFVGDVFFPQLDPNDWKLKETTPSKDENYSYEFCIYERKIA